MKTGDPFYKTAKWRKLRSAILRRDGYMCQISRRYGKTVQADTVHHIFPRDEFPEYAYSSWNLISVSNEAHNRLHDRVTDALTAEGVELLRRTAKKYGREIPERYGERFGDTERHEVPMNDYDVTLVCGYPGAGKTTWVRDHLGGDGLAYDLDAIAAAFRLREPHEERHDASRRMANDLLYGFIHSAGEYSRRLFIIRTAPTIEELEDIAPARVVMLLKRYVERPCGANVADRLDAVRVWCGENEVAVTII